MRTRLQDYRMLWRAAVTHADSRSTRFVRGFVLFAVLLLGAAAGMRRGAQAAIALFWMAAFTILLLNWAWRFMPGAVKLNTPANAKLVPQMRRRLVELSCLVCWVCIVGIASAPYAEKGGMLFLFVLFAVGTGLAASGHMAGSAVVVAITFGAVFGGQAADTFFDLLSRPAMLLLALPLYAGAVVVAVHAMFPQAGERHWGMEARRQRWQERAGKGDPLVERTAGAHTRGWYAALLRRDCARRDGPRLLLHALGPSHQPADMAAAIALMTVVLAVLGVFTAWRVDADTVRGIGWLFAALLLFVPLSHSLRLGQLAGSHAAEQALAPAAPATAAAFNRRLGRSVLLRAFAGWAMASGTALALVALGGAEPGTLLRLAGICCLSLPMVALPLRDHAARGQLSGLVGILLVLLSCAGCLALAFALAGATGLPAMALAGLLGIAVAALAVQRGLRRMAQDGAGALRLPGGTDGLVPQAAGAGATAGAFFPSTSRPKAVANTYMLTE